MNAEIRYQLRRTCNVLERTPSWVVQQLISRYSADLKRLYQRGSPYAHERGED